MTFRDSRRLEVAFNGLREEAEDLGLSSKNKARLAELMTIWASAYLEASCREIMMRYAKKRAAPAVASYVIHHLNRFHNPKAEKILMLVRIFDDNIAENLSVFSHGRIKDSINSIVDNRHRIAHGRATGIKMAQIVQYFDDARKFTNKMASLFLD